MNFIIYFARSIKGKDSRFLFEDTEKWPIYKAFFQKLQSFGFQVYLASFEDHFLEKDLFRNPLIFSGEEFISFSGDVSTDILFDRSYSSHTPSQELNTKTFNPVQFKRLCGNKEKTYQLLSKHMPNSWTHENSPSLQAALEELPERLLFVIKPALGIKGSGIYIDTAKNLLRNLPDKSYPYILQEFVDTTRGIPGVTSSVHDLRFVSCNGKIILAALRVPAPGSLLANVAKGGSIEEIPLKKIPENIVEVVSQIHERVEGLYPKSCYSMDFGYDVSRGKAFLFELNDRIGFPRPGMSNAYCFAEELALSILDFSKKLS